MRKASGAEALFASAFMYAITGILVREVSPMWGDKAQVAARFILVLILLSCYSLLKNNKIHLPKSKLPIAVLLGLSFAMMVLLFTAALGKTTIANVLFVFYGSTMISSFVGFPTHLLSNCRWCSCTNALYSKKPLRRWAKSGLIKTNSGITLMMTEKNTNPPIIM